MPDSGPWGGPVNDPCGGVINVYKFSDSAQQIENDIVVFCHSAGVNVRVTSRLRTCRQQRDLYYAGRTTAAPGTSQHEFGMAFDIVPVSGFQQYGVSWAETLAWLGSLATYFGAGQALNEGDHMHVGVYSNNAWRAFLAARDVSQWVPIPSRKPPVQKR